MIVSLMIVLGTLALMGVAAWHANATLPSGQLPMGRTNKPNTNRLVVVLQQPILYLAALALILAKDAMEGKLLHSGTLSTFALLSVSIVMLVAQ